jgi:hypothetical protein
MSLDAFQKESAQLYKYTNASGAAHLLHYDGFVNIPTITMLIAWHRSLPYLSCLSHPLGASSLRLPRTRTPVPDVYPILYIISGCADLLRVPINLELGVRARWHFSEDHFPDLLNCSATDVPDKDEGHGNLCTEFNQFNAF